MVAAFTGSHAHFWQSASVTRCRGRSGLGLAIGSRHDAHYHRLGKPMNTARIESVTHWKGGRPAERGEEVALEEPLEIRVRGRAISVTMRTPGHDAELAIGFLLTEGIIRRAQDVLRAQHCGRNEEGNVIDILLAPDVAVDFERLTRHVFASSSCGLCGKATIDSVRGRFGRIDDGDSAMPPLILSPSLLARLPDLMRRQQEAFDRTGGIHAAALFDENGKLIALREDIGRHNAVDKVLGYALTHGLVPMSRHVLLLSGRSSFEIMQKALAGRVPIVAAVSAPSSLAVRFAEESGQTLVGFLREGRMNVYTGGKRIAEG